MNKYQKALDWLSLNNNCDEDFDAVDELQKLVNKATPRRVEMATREEYMQTGYKHKCPVCGSLVGTITNDLGIEYDDYCCSCGQALDWSEE